MHLIRRKTTALCAGLAGVCLAAFAQTPQYKITTVAGGGTCGTNQGDGGHAISGCLTEASDVALDSAGNLYMSRGRRHRQR